MPRHAHYVPNGVIPAVLLPFAEDFSIDESAFRKHLTDVAGVEGLTAITVNAHSTEVASCSVEEQRRVLEVAADEVGDRLPIVNGVWADGSLEAARIARMAAAGGVHARPVARDGARALQTDRRRVRPAADRLPVSARYRPGLSGRDPASS